MEASPATQQRAARFKKIRQVTLPVLKLKKDIPRYVAILTVMRTGKQLDDKKAPATICEAVDMETGELGVLVIPTIMQKELDQGYPNASYVRRGFEVITTMDKDNGDGTAKRYNHVSLCEVGVPEDVVLPNASMFTRDAEGKTAAPVADIGKKR